MTPEEQFKSNLALGDQQESQGNFSDSQRSFAIALAVCRKHQLPAGFLAVALSRLSVNAVNRNDIATAAESFAATISVFEGDGHRDTLEYADCLTHYAHLLRGKQQWSAAIDNYAKAYLLYREITSLPAKDVQQRRLALRNSLRSTAEQADDSVREELRKRVYDLVPPKDSPLFP